MEIEGDKEINGDKGRMFCYTIGIYLPKSEAISPSNFFIYTEVELAKLK